MKNNAPSFVIYPFREEWKDAFRDINLGWLKKYYVPTDEDMEQLSHPEKIRATGGEIFFAVLNELPVGVAALVCKTDEEAELAKMGVLEASQGQGIGEALIRHVIAEAKKRKVKRLFLGTAKELQAAIHLYEKTGFRRCSEEQRHPRFGRMTFDMEILF